MDEEYAQESEDFNEEEEIEEDEVLIFENVEPYKEEIKEVEKDGDD